MLALLTVAVAATTAGVAFVTNALEPARTTVAFPGSSPQLASDIAALRDRFGEVDVVWHQSISVPGSVMAVDLRAQDPNGAKQQPSLRLLSGRYPAGAGEVAVTRGVADLFDVRIGGAMDVNGRARTVVGLVENPLSLHERFALVAPGQADPPARVTVHIPGVRSFQSVQLPSGTAVSIAIVSGAERSEAAAAAVLAMATMGLLFVGLIAVAGFTVMAQRRLRALGMLGALGATDRHVRLVMLANGAAVGAVAAVAGAATGVGGWLMLAPRLETLVNHRMDRFDLPWWAIGAAMLLAVVTAVVAAWWPARAASRVPVVVALSGRPPRPQPAHRLAAAGAVLLAAGLVLLGAAQPKRAPFIIGGTVATTLAVLFLAPLAIRGLAGAGRWAPIAVRLALRDLARYQGRAGAAVGAIALAVGIAATIAVSAAATAAADGAAGGNLAANQVLVHLSPEGAGAPLPDKTPAELQALEAGVDSIAAALGTQDVVALDAAVNSAAGQVPGLGTRPGGKGMAALVRPERVDGETHMTAHARLYVATPALLARYGIQPGEIDPSTDVLTARRDLGGTLILYGPRQTTEPRFQAAALPTHSSGPNALATTRAVQRLGLETRVAGWLFQTSRPLTGAQIDAARRAAAGAGLTIETRDTQQSLKRLGQQATAAGMILALGVLAMTVGLIRSETANDLRILTAMGASGTARRAVTGATAGALALLGAVLGTAGAYGALVAWHRSDLTNVAHPPVANLVAILIGLPLVAGVAGWLLAGREPSAIARRPLDA